MRVKSFTLALFIAVTSFVSGQSFDGMKLIAHYPLQVNEEKPLG